MNLAKVSTSVASPDCAQTHQPKFLTLFSPIVTPSSHTLHPHETPPPFQIMVKMFWETDDVFSRLAFSRNCTKLQCTPTATWDITHRGCWNPKNGRGAMGPFNPRSNGALAPPLITPPPMHVLATGRAEKRATFYALRHGTILADLCTPCDISYCCSAGCQFWRQASMATKGLIGYIGRLRY